MAAMRPYGVFVIMALAIFVGPPGAGAASSVSRGSQQSVAAVQKVIKMLTDMSVKVKKESNDEQVAFAQFTTWCSQESASLKDEIRKNGEEMDMLDAEIGKLTSEVKALSDAIAKLNIAVSNRESEKKVQTAQREAEHKEFLAEEQDFSESVDALDRAIQVLQKQDYDRPSASAALLQVSNMERIPEKARSILTAFVGMMGGADQPGLSYQAPEANAYEFQSGNIIELLKKLKDDFRAKLAERQKEEMNSKHAYDMVINDLTDAIENANKDIAEKTVEMERKAEKTAQSKKQLASTTAVKAENEKTLAATTTECEEKTLSFKEKQNLRTEEIQAIQKAIEILSSPEVSGSADKYLSLAQAGKTRTTLVQLGEDRAAANSGTTRSAGIRRRVREFLAAEGRRLHSQQLGLLAEKMAADPFAKVKKLIDAMITRLLEEANEDANHEGFCDTEMGKSRITRSKLSEEIDGLTAAVEDGQATILKLTESTQTLTAEVAQLVKSMGEATEMRKNEKAQNAETVKDAQAAQQAVQVAVAVLKDFYEKASTATALMQAPSPRRWGLKAGVKMGSEEWNALGKPGAEGTVDTGHKEDMQTFGETYQGKQDEEDYGVLGLLEVIHSDFANLEADTQAAEAASQKAYDSFMIQSKKSKATKERKIELNNADQTAAEAKLRSDTADLKATQDELLAADRYHARLVPQCEDRGMTFEERTKAREEEIASLKKALEILSSEDIATSAL